MIASDAKDAGGGLGESRERLARLQSQEKAVRALRNREHELEVECIAADVVLKGAAATPERDIEPNLAVEIERALDLCRQLETATGDARTLSNEERDRLRIGRVALEKWIQARDPPPPDRTRRIVRRGLLAVTIIAISASIWVHPVFLVLLLPVAGAASLLAWSGQDTAFGRLGARRRYESTGLSAPSAWEESVVQSHLEALDAELAARAAQKTEGANVDAAQIAFERRNADAQLEGLLVELDMDRQDIDRDFERRLRQVAGARRARIEFEQIKSELRLASAEVDELREELFQFIARHGEAPSDGRADTSSLAAALDRVQRTGKRV